MRALVLVHECLHFRERYWIFHVVSELFGGENPNSRLGQGVLQKLGNTVAIGPVKQTNNKGSKKKETNRIES